MGDPIPTFKAKDLIAFFFTSCQEDGKYLCKNPKCKRVLTQKKNSGYTNLKAHLTSCVGKTYENMYTEILKSSKNKGLLDSHGFINTRETEVYKTMEWLVLRNMPLSELDNPLTRGMLNIKPISSKSMRKYILSLTPLIENMIGNDLPNKFAFQLDGWTMGSMHYIALFATYIGSDGILKEVLLALAPLLDDVTLGAEQHVAFIEATLALYNKSLVNVVAFIGDNCSVNKKISNDTGIPLIGCASHRFNLAVNMWLENHGDYLDVLESIHDLMIQLRQLKNAARLRALTDLCPVKNNDTRWSSKYDMAKRYIRIEEEVKKIAEVEDYVLSVRSRRKLTELMVHLSKFQSITKNLQFRGMSSYTVRSVFDVVIQDYDEMKHYLKADADIVNNPIFESALVKILSKDFLNMTDAEKEVSSVLKKNNATSSTDGSTTVPADDEGGYFAQCQSRKRRRLSEEEQEYMDCSFIVATSNTVERLFSACKHVLTDTRKCMSPIMFEALIFLKINRDFWDLTMVATAMKVQTPRDAERDLNDFYEQ